MPAWEQLERLLSGLYLKELEQEENIWRSLPFFSAALALEVVALNQIIPVAASLAGVWRWLIGAFGIGTYGRDDQVDVAWDAGGRPQVAQGLDIEPVP